MSNAPRLFASAQARLLTRRDQLNERLARVQADKRRELDPLSADSADRALQQENDEVVDSIGAAAEAELLEVSNALRRIESGEYGICESCCGEIDPQRMEAVPYALRCQACATSAAS